MLRRLARNRLLRKVDSATQGPVSGTGYRLAGGRIILRPIPLIYAHRLRFLPTYPPRFIHRAMSDPQVNAVARPGSRPVWPRPRTQPDICPNESSRTDLGGWYQRRHHGLEYSDELDPGDCAKWHLGDGDVWRLEFHHGYAIRWCFQCGRDHVHVQCDHVLYPFAGLGVRCGGDGRDKQLRYQSEHHE